MAITLTDVAAKEIVGIIEKQREDAKSDGAEPTPLYLRVGVKGGGCSGFSYSLDLTETRQNEDEAWEQEGVTVLCDSRSLIYLEGTTVDFKDGLTGRGFVFNNPNATSSCGCGSSFSA